MKIRRLTFVILLLVLAAVPPIDIVANALPTRLLPAGSSSASGQRPPTSAAAVPARNRPRRVVLLEHSVSHYSPQSISSPSNREAGSIAGMGWSPERLRFAL